MNQPELMYAVLSICAVVFTATIVYMAYLLTKTIKEVNFILEDVRETTNDITTMKNSMKSGVIGITSTILSKIANGLENKETNFKEKKEK